MKAQDCFGFEFTTKLEDDSLLVCPECKIISPLEQWRETELPCEDCGTHAAMRCPSCEEEFDHVYAKPFEVVG